MTTPSSATPPGSGRLLGVAARLHAACWGAALLLLAACGGGGGESPAGTDAGDGNTVAGQFMPLNLGDRRVYATSGLGGSTMQTATITGVVAEGGVSSHVNQVLGSNGEAGGRELLWLAADGLRGRIDGARDNNLGAWLIASATDARLVMRLPVRVGASDTVYDGSRSSGMDLDGDGRNETMHERTTVTILGLEAVSTAAGSFARTVHRQERAELSLTLSGSGRTLSVPVVTDDWWADGVGLVRRVTTMRQDEAGLNLQLTQELAAYRVGGVSSLAGAPKVVAVTPADGATLQGQEVTVRFDQPMDGRSLQSALVLIGPGGAPVEGSWDVDGALARLKPTRPIAGNGEHTLQIGATAANLLGEPLGQGQSSRFRFDNGGPILVARSPAAGESVAAGGALTLSFNRPIKAEQGYALEVMDAAGTRIDGQWVIDGAQARFTPGQGWRAGQLIRVRVGGVLTALDGTPAGVDQTFEYQVTQGAFSTPLTLGGAAGSAVSRMGSHGDFDGDGRAEWVRLIDDPERAGDVMLHRFHADRSLASTVRLAARRPDCGAHGLVAGRFTADALQLAVHRGPCGLEIYQVVEGAWRSVDLQPLAEEASGLLRAHDVDGDGRDEIALVAAGQAWRLYRRRGSDWQARSVLDLSLQGRAVFTDTAFADINRDGRPDAVWSQASEQGAAWGVSLQQADGSFQAVPSPTALPATGASALALADLDGDGRLDGVVAPQTGTPSVASLFTQDASGHFAPGRAQTLTRGVRALRLQDVNGDGRPDLICLHELGWGLIGLRLGGAEGFGPELLYPGEAYGDSGFQLADFDGDGHADLAHGATVAWGLGVRPPAQARPPGRAAQALGAAWAARWR